MNYVYSSDEYVSGTNSEIEEEDDGDGGADDTASHLGKSFQNATCSNNDSPRNNKKDVNQTFKDQEEEATWQSKNVLDQPLDIESQKTLEQ